MRSKGDIAEIQAINFLKINKFKVIEQNFYSKFGEIDIIASKNEVLHFVEVKSGVSFDPLQNITPAKLKKIIKTIDYYIMIKKVRLDYCISAIIIQNNNIEFLENIGFH